MAETKARLDETNARMSATEMRIDRTRTDLLAAMARVERRLDARVDGVDRRLDGVDARLDAVDAKLAGLEEGQAQTNARLLQLVHQVGALANREAARDAVTDDLHARVERLERGGDG